jgi:hypothetical protein
MRAMWIALIVLWLLIGYVAAGGVYSWHRAKVPNLKWGDSLDYGMTFVMVISGPLAWVGLLDAYKYGFKWDWIFASRDSRFTSHESRGSQP